MRFTSLARTRKVLGFAAAGALLAAGLSASAVVAGPATAAPISGPHGWVVNTVESPAYWRSTAASNDGATEVATEFVPEPSQGIGNDDGSRPAGCAIWVSHNSGQGWLLETTIPDASGCKVVSSGDGNHFVVIGDESNNHENVYTSSDSGETWTSHLDAIPVGWWIDMTMSDDGSHVWAVPGYAQESIQESDDYGATWHVDQTLGLEYRSIAATADGLGLYAYENGGIVLSTDGGQSWNYDSAEVQTGTYGDLATSSTGRTTLLAGYGIRVSSDFAQSWDDRTAATGAPGTSPYFEAAAISADGNIMVTKTGCSLYTSTDAGVTWQAQSLGSTCDTWSAITLTDDGTKFFATGTAFGSSGSLFVGSITAATEASYYVALGDSFQSGEGTFDYFADTATADDTCHRSPMAYPYLLTDTREVTATLDFRACSGATIGAMLTSNAAPKRDGAAQVTDLGPNTTLVTVGVVGNDLGFADTVHDCIVTDILTVGSPWAVNCQQSLNAGVNTKLKSLQNGALRKNLSDLYRLIRAKAPNARVVVVSYPQFFPAQGTICSYMRPSDQVWMNAMIVRADTEIDVAARAAGFESVNMSTVVQGHEQCTADPALNGVVGLLAAPNPESFHPNQLGQQLMAQRITATLGAPVGPSFYIKPAQTVTKTFVVEGHAFHVNVAWPGSDVETTLISPSGKIYSRQNPQDATHDNGPTYEYYDITDPEPGTWTVSSYGLNVSPDGEPVTITTEDETTPNALPTAVIKVSGSGSTYTFDGSASVDTDGSITGYEWDFGDGTIGSGSVTQHTYTTPGTYLATLVTTDNDGGQGFGAATSTFTVPSNNIALYSGSATSLTNNYLSLGSSSSTYVGGNFTCDSSVHIQGSVIVTGDAHLTSHCTIDGDITIGGSVTADSTPVIGGTLTAVGNVKYQSSAHVGGNIVAGGTFTSTDGLTPAKIIAKGSVVGTISSHASVPAIAASALPAVAMNTPAWSGFAQETWRQWMNTTAQANGAPSWSHGLSASPGCTMASYGDSVNGTGTSITTNTVIDATKATTGCSTVSLQGMTLTLKADLVIYADAFSSINGLTVASGDGLPHSLRILIPGTDAACTSAHTIALSSATAIDPLVGTRLYAPGKVTLTGAVSLHGEVQAGCVSQSGATALTYASVPTPGLDQ